MIPQHCIDKFKETFNVYPFIVELDFTDDSLVTKLLKKSLVKWVYSKTNEIKQIIQTEKLVEYDSSGIFMYYKTDDNLTFKLFILHTYDRQSVVDFTVHNILKTLKK